jgi:hypothetical protein
MKRKNTLIFKFSFLILKESKRETAHYVLTQKCRR